MDIKGEVIKISRADLESRHELIEQLFSEVPDPETDEGKEELHHRAIFMSELRAASLWPPDVA